jgi:hypothetical protein
MSHFILKLTSGEFVYGVLDENIKEKGMVILQNPLTWQEYSDDEGRLGSALVKYVNGTSENKIPISVSAIMSMAKMSPIFEEFYEAAVAIQQITDESYNENISLMTSRMYDLVVDYQDRKQALITNELVISSKKSSNTTIH